MKKAVLYLLIAVLAASPSVALAAETAETAQTVQTVQTAEAAPTVKMTIIEALDYALENSPSIIAAKLNVTYYEELLAQSRSNYRAMATKTASSDEEYLIKSGYRRDQSEMAVNVAKRSLQQTTATTKADVYSYFYTYISGVKKIEIAQTALSQAKTRLEQAKAKYSNGTLSALDVSTFETEVLRAENSLAQAKRSSDINMQTLKNYIGFPQNGVLEVSGNLELNSSVALPTLSEVSKLAEEKNPNILAIKESMELEERMMDTYDKWYTSNTFVYRIQKAAHEKQMHDYNTQLNAVRLSVSQLHNALTTATESYALLESQLENLKKSYEVVKAQYEMGMTTATDFIDISQQLTNVENSILDIKVAVILATSNYMALYNEDYNELVSQQTKNEAK